MQPKFGRIAAKLKVQLLPGPITSLNENPSLVALGKLTANEPESLALWGNGVGRTDGWTKGRTDGRMDGGARSARFGMDGRMDGWTAGLAPLASEWTDFFEFL